MSFDSLPEHLKVPHLRPIQPFPVNKDGKQFVALRDPQMLHPQTMVIPAPAMGVPGRGARCEIENIFLAGVNSCMWLRGAVQGCCVAIPGRMTPRSANLPVLLAVRSALEHADPDRRQGRGMRRYAGATLPSSNG